MFVVNLLEKFFDLGDLSSNEHVVGLHDMRNKLGQRTGLEFALAGPYRLCQGGLERFQDFLDIQVRSKASLFQGAISATAKIDAQLLEQGNGLGCLEGVIANSFRGS